MRAEVANPFEITWDVGGKTGQQESRGSTGAERRLSQSCSVQGYSINKIIINKFVCLFYPGALPSFCLKAVSK